MLEDTRRGYVLIGVLLVLLALTGVGHTLLVLTRSELFASQARWDVLTRRLAAEMGRNLTSDALAGTDSLPWGEWVPMGSGAVPPRARYHARVARLSREVLLILVEGSLDTAPGRNGQVGLYWAMDPVARYAAARGVLERGGSARVETGSVVDPNPIRDTPAHWPEASCVRFSPDVDTLFLGGLSPQGELREDPRAEMGRGVATGVVQPRLPSLGLLGHDALTEAPDLRVAGTVSPEPVHRFGRCALNSPTNWGAPLDASDPCIAYKPLVTSDGPLIVDGGQGQGVLLVAGDAPFGLVPDTTGSWLWLEISKSPRGPKSTDWFGSAGRLCSEAARALSALRVQPCPHWMPPANFETSLPSLSRPGRIHTEVRSSLTGTPGAARWLEPCHFGQSGVASWPLTCCLVVFEKVVILLKCLPKIYFCGDQKCLDTAHILVVT